MRNNRSFRKRQKKGLFAIGINFIWKHINPASKLVTSYPSYCSLNTYNNLHIYEITNYINTSHSHQLEEFSINPISRGLKYNLFHAGRGIYAPPRDFALVEPILHQKLCHFIHIKFEQFVGHRKRKQHFKSKNVVVAMKKKFVAWNVQKNFGRFKTLFQIGIIFLDENKT